MRTRVTIGGLRLWTERGKMIGESVGSYRISAVLGQGGMGVVYAAEHPLLGRRVAIKFLLPELSQKQEMISRFFNEARSTTMIKHPGLVDVFDFGYHASGSAYIVMEFLDGESLGHRLQRQRPLPTEVIVSVARQLANAIGAAHRKGIVHRDLKPDNIYLLPDEESAAGVRVKVLDFGIAKLQHDAGGNNTRTGSVMGTPLYMSPEQCRGAGLVDHRADIYSMGCILYELASGRPPFQGEGMGDLLVAHLTVPPTPLRQLAPHVPPVLEGVIMRALEKRVDLRQQSMDELAGELDALDGGSPSRASNRSRSVPPMAVLPHQQATAYLPPGGNATTTLGGAAGQALTGPPAMPTRGRKWLLPAAIGGVATLGLVVVLATRGGGAENRSAADQPGAAPAPLPAEVTLQIDSEPAGAEVLDARTRGKLGVTPLAHKVARIEGELRLIIRLTGHQDAQVALPTDSDGRVKASLIAAVEPVQPVLVPPTPTPPTKVAVTDKPLATTTTKTRPAVKKPVKKKPATTLDPFED